MKLRGAGVSLLSNDTVSQFDKLRAKLAKVKEAGFDAVELPIAGMKLIVNGAIDRARLDAYVGLLREFPLQVTVHAPFDMNLFRQDHLQSEQRVFMASLEIAGAIGAQMMVYHVGRFVGEEQFMHPHTWKIYSESEKQRLMEEEIEFLRLAGNRARQLSLRIGMENMRPYLDCRDYCYSVIPQALALQVEAINHPHVGIALDVGHLHMAVRMYELNLRQQLEAMLPYVMHLHIHDNFGRASFSTEKNQYELVQLGRGDMHVPIGNGEVPIREIVSMLAPTFDGFLIHEIRDQYESVWAELPKRFDQLPDAGTAGDGLRTFAG
ncbi:sugar phosphate isomerase/epimerase family protein [Paenibacillus piri]|uniref:Sugar phosphate isomerase/epimerase n=1 Tax=Paenibacillus piri TaxID=2547395 RepID=A0A4R5KZA1_9BACL|nr:sugar phosphate isomerase/epimerase family protein [Paenibacillus piri]TDG00566.1 sugar phosphate isomerase/epimerase [Paenibacillus piri]